MADVNSVRKVSHEPFSIELRESDERFTDFNNRKVLALDVGCSLIKVAYYSQVKHKPCWNCWKNNLTESNHQPNGNCSGSSKIQTNQSPTPGTLTQCDLSLKENCNKIGSNHLESASHNSHSSENCQLEPKPHLHFVKFETKQLENCLDFIGTHLLANNESPEESIVKVTGRGVFKYQNCIQEKLGLVAHEEDETCCLIKGTNYLLKNIDVECFSFRQNENPDCVFYEASFNCHPYLLVNIGSDVSVYKVTDEDCYEKIGASTTGGATFLGLGSLLTSAKEADGLFELAENGDYRKVDLLVEDLFETDSTSSGDLIAASFGKIHPGEPSQKKFSEADLARSLLITVLNSIGQVATLYAMMNNYTKVYFGGFFLRNNSSCMNVLARSVNYWSQEKIKAVFLRHGGYLRTVGAFLKGVDQCRRQNSSLFDGLQRGGSHNTNQYSVCPLLLSPDSYRPDLMDLIQDEEAREYWLECFEGTVEKLAKKAMESQTENPTARQRADGFKEKFLDRLRQFKTNPPTDEVLTVRTILDMIPSFLNEFDFPDPYLNQKAIENEKALLLFENHVRSLDALDLDTRHRKLILYLIAGNMFDWGAKEVSVLLETNNFGFEDALSKIPERPWVIDSLDDWIRRLEGPPHKCAVVFVDNSGFDIILGILPFVRELLRRGTEVILCSNSGPALNDVIHTEMLDILEKVKGICPIIKEAEESGRLIAIESGQMGPCLDLSRLKRNLCEEMTSRKVDLIVIEGMGRSVHTNLNTQFKCESLKVAVIKNRWLAQRLKGTMFCVLCQYTNKPT